MSEEVQSASINVPRAVMASVLINGMLGFGMLIAVLFTLGDIRTVLQEDYIYPFITIFLQSNSSVQGTTAMSSIIIALTFLSAVGVLATSSRMMWSFARDRGLPGWQWLSRVGRPAPYRAALMCRVRWIPELPYRWCPFWSRR